MISSLSFSLSLWLSCGCCTYCFLEAPWVAQGAPEGSLGTPWGAREDPWEALGASGRLLADQGRTFEAAFGNRWLCKFIVLQIKSVQFGSRRVRREAFGRASSQRWETKAAGRDPQYLERRSWIARGDAEGGRRGPKSNRRTNSNPIR